MKKQQYFQGDPTALRILSESIKLNDISRWNSWRSSNNEAIDLTGISLDNVDISGADFSNCIMDRAWFYESRITRCDFTRATLKASKFFKANIHESSFQRSILSNSDFDKSECIDVEFGEASANKCDFSSATVRNSKFDNAKFSGTDFRYTEIENSSLRSIKLRGANLLESKINDCCLELADLRRTSWVKANVTRSTLTGCQIWGWSTESWCIEGIACDYIFDDEEGQTRTPSMSHPIPKRRIFEPGEFEKIFRYAPSFKIAFENGFQALDVVLINYVVATIAARSPYYGVDIASIDNKAHCPEITIRHEQAADKEKIRREIYREYEEELSRLRQSVSTLTHRNEILTGELRTLGTFLDFLKESQIELIRRPPSITVSGNQDSKVVVVQDAPNARIEIDQSFSEIDSAVAENNIPPSVGKKLKELISEYSKEGGKEISKLIAKEIYQVAKNYLRYLPHLVSSFYPS